MKTHSHPLFPTIKTTLLGLAVAALSLGCDAEAPESGEDDFRAQPLDSPCTMEKGDFAAQCQGANCAVELDYVLICPDDESASDLQLALSNKRVWGNFRGDGGEYRSFLVKGHKLKFVEPLPGRGFAGQAVDGTMYRYLDGAAYLRAKTNHWDEVPVVGLPGDYDSFEGFRIRPDGAGGLHASFRTGDESGTFRFATYENDTWTWIPIGSWDPNVVDAYVGKDAWDRTHSLIHTLDWETGPQILLRFSHWDAFPVGDSGDLGRVANPPRPELGGEAPIATLRAGDGALELLSIIDGDDWSEEPIAGTELLEVECPVRYNSATPDCPPCHDEVQGVEDEGFQLARTSGGPLWGAWVVTEASADLEYTPTPFGSNWRCTVSSSSAEASGVLHLVELAVDGTALRTLELPLPELGFHPRGGDGYRPLAIAAYDDRVALMFPSNHLGAAGDELVMRVLVFDTADID